MISVVLEQSYSFTQFSMPNKKRLVFSKRLLAGVAIIMLIALALFNTRGLQFSSDNMNDDLAQFAGQATLSLSSTEEILFESSAWTDPRYITNPAKEKEVKLIVYTDNTATLQIKFQGNVVNEFQGGQFSSPYREATFQLGRGNIATIYINDSNQLESATYTNGTRTTTNFFEGGRIWGREVITDNQFYQHNYMYYNSSNIPSITTILHDSSTTPFLNFVSWQQVSTGWVAIQGNDGIHFLRESENIVINYPTQDTVMLDELLEISINNGWITATPPPTALTFVDDWVNASNNSQLIDGTSNPPTLAEREIIVKAVKPAGISNPYYIYSFIYAADNQGNKIGQVLKSVSSSIWSYQPIAEIAFRYSTLYSLNSGRYFVETELRNDSFQTVAIGGFTVGIDPLPLPIHLGQNSPAGGRTTSQDDHIMSLRFISSQSESISLNELQFLLESPDGSISSSINGTTATLTQNGQTFGTGIIQYNNPQQAEVIVIPLNSPMTLLNGGGTILELHINSDAGIVQQMAVDDTLKATYLSQEVPAVDVVGHTLYY
jgi:hypothetical protein